MASRLPGVCCAGPSMLVAFSCPSLPPFSPLLPSPSPSLSPSPPPPFPLPLPSLSPSPPPPTSPPISLTADHIAVLLTTYCIYSFFSTNTSGVNQLDEWPGAMQRRIIAYYHLLYYTHETCRASFLPIWGISWTPQGTDTQTLCQYYDKLTCDFLRKRRLQSNMIHNYDRSMLSLCVLYNSPFDVCDLSNVYE